MKECLDDMKELTDELENAFEKNNMFIKSFKFKSIFDTWDKKMRSHMNLHRKRGYDIRDLHLRKPRSTQKSSLSHLSGKAFRSLSQRVIRPETFVLNLSDYEKYEDSDEAELMIEMDVQDQLSKNPDTIIKCSRSSSSK